MYKQTGISFIGCQANRQNYFTMCFNDKLQYIDVMYIFHYIQLYITITGHKRVIHPLIHQRSSKSCNPGLLMRDRKTNGPNLFCNGILLF